MLGYIRRPIQKNCHCYVCNSCSHSCNSLYHIKAHLEHHINPEGLFNCESNNLKKYRCLNCDFETDLLLFLKQHIKKFHDILENDLQVSCAIEDTIQSFICRNCSFETYSALQWLNHERLGCTKINTDNSLSQEKLKTFVAQGTKWFRCVQGDFQTKVKRSLQKHLNARHTSDETKTKQPLNRHILSKHIDPSNIRWFQCDQCPYKAKQNYQLKTHLRVKHSNENRCFECDQCNYKCKRKSTLKQHEIVNHTNREEMNWICCEKCSYKTVIKDNLRKHMLTHMAPEKILWYRCDQCLHTTKDKRSFKSHMLLKHTDEKDIKWFECGQCAYKGKTKRQLTRHVNIKHAIK